MYDLANSKQKTLKKSKLQMKHIFFQQKTQSSR